MLKPSNSKLISIFSKILVLIVIAKSLSLVMLWYLPSDGKDIKLQYNYQPAYQRVNFKSMIKAEVVKKVVKAKPKKDGINITNMILKGLYGTDKKGFVIVAMKAKSKKTEIIGIGEIFKGYKLKSILLDSAIFEKNSKDYILYLDESKRSKNKRANKKRTNYITRVVRTEDTVGVSRQDIAHYAKNPRQIWREISINEVRNGKKIEGFKVTRIQKGSKFETLGLKKGDLIIKANNVRLVSYKDALDIYNKIDQLNMIQIVVIRDNEEVELVYDIN